MVAGFVEYSRMTLLFPDLVPRSARVPNIEIIAIGKVFIYHMFGVMKVSKVTVVNHCPCQLPDR
jgi:hypothetical protein